MKSIFAKIFRVFLHNTCANISSQPTAYGVG